MHTPRANAWTPGTPSRLADDTAALRRDIEGVLAGPMARGLLYRLEQNSVVLSGRIDGSSRLYDLMARLEDLPGVRSVAFENVRFVAP